MTAGATPWVVLKFGGTSVSRRNRWDTIGRLASKRMAEDGARVLVVVSALSGVTNELQAISNGDDIAGHVCRHRPEHLLHRRRDRDGSRQRPAPALWRTYRQAWWSRTCR